MLKRQLFLCLGMALCTATAPFAQVTLNSNPSRVVGQPQLPVVNVNPNLVEGRELNGPQGVALDTSISPPILYVSDTGNNRVLAWRNAAQFANGAPADLVVGQKDKYNTLPQGPGGALSTGLSGPNGVAVLNGNLYVVDVGNNRVLRYPAPFAQQGQILPDLVIGQPNFSSRGINTGGISEKSLSLSGASVNTGLAFDSSGNLYLADSANHRVLRYRASDLRPGNNAPAADLVIGQVDFLSNTALSATAQGSGLVANRFNSPASIALDVRGRLYVSDAIQRVLVFDPSAASFTNGMSASRVMGAVGTPAPAQDVQDKTRIGPGAGVFIAGNTVGIADPSLNRILLFDPPDTWPAPTTTAPSPQARGVLGQDNDFTIRLSTPNHGQPEPSASTLSTPVAAAFSGSELFVADTANHRLLVLPQQGATFGAATRVLGQTDFSFNSVNLVEGRELHFIATVLSGGRALNVADAGIAIDQSSDPQHLYIADTYNNRILGYRDLRKVRPGDTADLVIGQPDMFRTVCNYPTNDFNKPTASSLCGPAGIAVDSAGNLWVADTLNSRVLRFPQPFASPGSMPQADLVLGQASFGGGKITDPTARTMNYPYGIAVVGEDGIIVSDTNHNRILFFPKAGGFSNGMAATKVIGQPDFTSSAAAATTGSADNRLNAPRHISADSDGRPYIADTGTSRVLIFDQIAGLPAADARAAVVITGGANSARNPRGIFVSQQTGEFWVTDSGTGRALRYPRFDQLALNNLQPNASVPTVTGLALAQDSFGDLYIADAANRVAIYYPGVAGINAANFLVGRALAPGAIASLFPMGNTFGQDTANFNQLPNPLPLPTTLADIQVLVNGQPAPLFYVSPGQINFQLPMNSPTTGSADIEVVRPSTGQILGAGAVAMNVASPALFTAAGNGNGQLAALNQDFSVNSPTNPAARGTIISLFGTGQGFVPGAPPDGDVPQGLVPTDAVPRVIVGTCFVDDQACTKDPEAGVTFSGLAPGLVGVWQINVRIPTSVAPGNSTIVVVTYKSIQSNDPARIRTTISVKQ